MLSHMWVVEVNKSGDLFTRQILNSISRICNENSTVYNTSLYGDLKECGKNLLRVSLYLH